MNKEDTLQIQTFKPLEIASFMQKKPQKVKKSTLTLDDTVFLILAVLALSLSLLICLEVIAICL